MNIQLREIFADLTVTFENKKSFFRALNRKDQLVSGFQEALALVPEDLRTRENLEKASVTLMADQKRIALREGWGAEVALLVTEGFENHLASASPHVKSDLVFGISERMSPEGLIEKNLDPKEIQNVIEKLKLSGVEGVAVCFLHSDMNPENEKTVATLFHDHGIPVALSNTFDGDERARCKAAVAQAFTFNLRDELENRVVELGFKKENIKVQEFEEILPPLLKMKGKWAIEILEDRILFHGRGEDDLIVTEEAKFSPTSVIELNGADHPRVGPAKVESEPGPAFFSRGLVLTFFDVLALKENFNLSQISKLKTDFARLQRLISPLARKLKLDPVLCAQKFVDIGSTQLALEAQNFCHRHGLLNREFSLFGPLGSFFKGPLEKLLNARAEIIFKERGFNNVQ